jgi:hypothetical protein
VITSALVAPGRSYPFQVGHCSLLHVVDFSGSYWVVDETTLSAGERGQSGINGNEGHDDVGGFGDGGVSEWRRR